jgi:hypothetical protein
MHHIMDHENIDHVCIRLNSSVCIVVPKQLLTIAGELLHCSYIIPIR